MTEEDVTSTSPSLQKTILRLVQTNGTIERSALGMRSRSYDQENWEAVLDDLIDRGLITEDAQIRIGATRRQKRAVIVYRLNQDGLLRSATLVTIDDLPRTETEFVAPMYPDFASMTAESVQAFVAKFPKGSRAVAASAS
jgi:hypothetical protein